MSFRNRVAGIINRRGTSATYKSLTGVARNTTTLQNTPTFADYTIKIAMRTYRAFELSGLVQQGDEEVRIGAAQLSVTPKQDDRIVVGSQSYNVVSVDRRDDLNEPLLYILQVRGK